ncbi:cyclohexanone monooxygenase [Dendrothele bispora CBS 962.96]|uniref:Cyclohexanone monooxygenase n=1 Tax=Dendrothele bispora (strain CBS 962.96) TaxID=1314807 RepID=A0A4S8MMY3_DENBC|nr:cyclohexanone monooxygenase [Dendrothele bispora CBS 962.96]
MKDHNSSLDVLIVGSGFAGIYQLYQLRKLGYSVHIFDAAGDTGGTWYWNCYPGARVDSEIPFYELSIQDVWKGWAWTERFPGWKELRKYFNYLDEKLNVKKDISFNTRVVSARWNSSSDRWIVTAENGQVAHPRFLILCTGFSSMPYVPDFKGLESFEGICHHTARWPHEDVDMKGKRVGVIVGTGASGVQVIQEIGPEVGHLTVFQRTPNLAIPMRQEKLSRESQEKRKGLYPTIYKRRRQTYTGYYYDRYPKSTLEATPEERLLYLEELWAQGGFHFITSNYNDLRTNQEANDEIYAFWRQKVRERLHDPYMQEKLAPTIPPHPFGVKRPCLEQHYYEVFNQSNVTLVDLDECPITEITAKGIRTADGVEHELDAIVLATGFDSLTGGITQIDIKGVDGGTIAEKWKPGVYSYLGMTSANFPNLFFMYGPQGPTAFCNGPTCLEIQGDWIANCVKYMIENNYTRIEADAKAEQDWRQRVLDISARGLWSKAKSWYMGANIPGKAIEPLNWAGGVQNYDRICIEIAEKGYEGFNIR